MQGMINYYSLVVEGMLEGFVKTYPRRVAKTENMRVLK